MVSGTELQLITSRECQEGKWRDSRVAQCRTNHHFLVAEGNKPQRSRAESVKCHWNIPVEHCPLNTTALYYLGSTNSQGNPGCRYSGQQKADCNSISMPREKEATCLEISYFSHGEFLKELSWKGQQRAGNSFHLIMLLPRHTLLEHIRFYNTLIWTTEQRTALRHREKDWSSSSLSSLFSRPAL